MTLRFPDSPRLIDLDMLRKLDAEPAGTYLAQPKIDGVRRMCYKTGGVWTYYAKNKKEPVALPDGLRQEWESLPWPDGIGLDCELSGPRDVGGVPMLWVFDLLMLDGQWHGGYTFRERRARIYDIVNPHECNGHWEQFRRSGHIRVLNNTPNPDMVDLLERQKENPLSEGIVVSRADRQIVGSYRHSATPDAGYYKVKFARTKA